MESPFQLKTGIINLIGALIIAFIVVFPDIIRLYESNESRLVPPQEQLNKPGIFDKQLHIPQRPDQRHPENFQSRQAPPFNNVSNILYEFFLFYLLSLSLLFVNTNQNHIRKILPKSKKTMIIFQVLANLAVYIFFFIAYNLFGNNFLHSRFIGPFFFNGMLIFKCLFVGLVTILFGLILRLINKQHEMDIENEFLRSENLQNRFDALTSQVNPHFFFNSLNSLASLVREKNYKGSLKYINELSDIFRYILKKKWKELVPLADEIKFIDAYKYMLEIRYEDKLFFNIGVNEEHLNTYQLPVLSLQPIIENVVKHNIISSDNPLSIEIIIDNENNLIVSNKIQKKLDNIGGTGIGLHNLDNRYRLLTNKGIIIETANGVFKVKLPMIKIKNTD